jgi:60S ribosomal subunit assembly/export protein LOC1
VKPKKKRQRVYTDKELGLPALNMITPAGVQKPKGKKGKIFVDDRESMMTILAMVNAEKEGQIESKIMKARKMEEIREARRKEAEARHEKKNEKLEETKKSLKKKKPTKTSSTDDSKQASGKNDQSAAKKSEKRVSFA